MPMAPNQVYRALDRLGPRIRRIETLNAYVKSSGTLGAITIGRRCGCTNALGIEIDAEIDRLCKSVDFGGGPVIAEVSGLCPRCREKVVNLT